MKVVNYLEVEPVRELPGVVMREVITAEEAPRFYMSVYELEPGGATSIHAHWWEHELFILSGQGLIDTGQEKIPISQDKVIFMVPDEPHGFINNGNHPLRYILLNPRNR